MGQPLRCDHYPSDDKYVGESMMVYSGLAYTAGSVYHCKQPAEIPRYVDQIQ